VRPLPDTVLTKYNLSFEQLVLLKGAIARHAESLANGDAKAVGAPALAAVPRSPAAAPAATPGLGARYRSWTRLRLPVPSLSRFSGSGAPAAAAPPPLPAKLTRAPSLADELRHRGLETPDASDPALDLSTTTAAAASGELVDGATTGPAPLVPRPRVSSDNVATAVEETIVYFLELARRGIEGAPANKLWQPVKRPPAGLSIMRRAAGATLPADVIRATIKLACPAERAYAALRGARYRSVVHPDLLSCDSLVAYDDATVVRHYRFKGSLLPDREWVVLEAARAIAPGEWVVVQRSVAAEDLLPRTNAVRLTVHVAGYYVHTAPQGGPAASGGNSTAAAADPEGLSSCYITHVLQLSSQTPTIALQWLRYSWAWNLATVKYALERSVEGGDVSRGLPHVASSKLAEVEVKAGGLAWFAIPHVAVPPDAGDADPRHGRLVWEFSARGGDLRFSVVFAAGLPELAAGAAAPHTPSPSAQVLLTASGTEVVLPSQVVTLNSRQVQDSPAPWEGARLMWPVVPSAVFNCHVCPVTAAINVSPRVSGTYFLVFDNRASRFSDRHVVYKAALTYYGAASSLDGDAAETPSSPRPTARATTASSEAAAAHSTELLADPEVTAEADRWSPRHRGYAAEGEAPPTPPAEPSTAVLRRHGLAPYLEPPASSAALMAPPYPTDAHITADVVVGRGDVLRMPLDLFRPVGEVRLAWEFRCGKDEIDFSIVFQEWTAVGQPGRVHDVTTLLERGRVSTETDAFAGELRTVGRPGRYFFVWDNSHSRWKSRMVGFSVLMDATAPLLPLVDAPASTTPRTGRPPRTPRRRASAAHGGSGSEAGTPTRRSPVVADDPANGEDDPDADRPRPRGVTFALW